MLNYVKSEMYRVLRSKGVYLTIGGCMALILAMNLVLWYFRMYTPNFPYGTTKFSFSMLTTGMAMPLCLTAFMGILVFGDEYKNKTFSNSVAFGYSRELMFFGKLMVTLAVSAIGLLLVEGTLIGSAYLLLEDSGIEFLKDILRASIACIPAFVAGVSGVVALLFIARSEMNAVWSWIGIMIGVSAVVSILGMKIKIFAKLSGWLLWNMVSSVAVDEKTSSLVMIWTSKEGFYKLILAGILGTAIFIAAGLIGIKKRK